jgi:hypothetical protein
MLGHKSVWFVRKPQAEQQPAETYEPPLLKRA